MNQTKVQDFVADLRNHYDHGHHVVVSWEGLSLLSDERLDLLGTVFRAAGYEPRIVVSSRHYHEWVPSWIQQYYRPAGYNPQNFKFEDAGGARIPTTQQFLEDPIPYHRHCYFGFDDCHYDWLATDNAPAANVRNRFQRFFNDVQMFRYNQGGDLVTNFICQALQFADNTCRGLQDGELSAPPRLQEAIPRIIMDYEYLSQAAYGKYDLVKYSKKRRNLVMKVKRHHQRKISKCVALDCDQTTLHPFDLQCQTDSEKQIFTNRTISYEREVFPDDFGGSDGGQKHESLLRTMVLDKMEDDKYCVINVDKTLAEPWWDVFFTYLEEGIDPYKNRNPPW
jgi:hypothetical protein